MSEKRTKKRVFSGVQPSGNLHIGNYLGAIKSWLDLQDRYETIFCVVDLHAITVFQDPKILKEKIREVAALFLAVGVDSKKSTLFVQSEVSAHSELAWILNCFTPIGWLTRMTQFKEKSKGKKERVSAGLFDYPVLMAADILLYKTDFVPVGEDQQQHVELTRDIAKRFNAIYGQTFKVPKGIIPKTGSRIMRLDNPLKKMSKSEGSALYLLDSADDIFSKIMSATTDSLGVIKFNKDQQGIHNLLVIYELLSGEEKSAIESRFEGRGYADFKKELADLVTEKLKPIQSRYYKLRKEKGYIDNLLKEGASRARSIAEKTLSEVKKKIGLGLAEL
jgi:tryptophanyl-tRNA synthetase